MAHSKAFCHEGSRSMAELPSEKVLDDMEEPSTLREESRRGGPIPEKPLDELFVARSMFMPLLWASWEIRAGGSHDLVSRHQHELFTVLFSARRSRHVGLGASGPGKTLNLAQGLAPRQCCFVVVLQTSRPWNSAHSIPSTRAT